MSSSYRDLKVWQKAMDFVVRTYELTQTFPPSELYGLSSQLRRAAVSVASNIAEGKGRSDKDFSRFLLQARGSVWEAETQLEIARRLKYLDVQTAQELLAAASELSRMLNGMLNALARPDREAPGMGD
jgi:four helix bundle protein